MYARASVVMFTWGIASPLPLFTWGDTSVCRLIHFKTPAFIDPLWVKAGVELYSYLIAPETQLYLKAEPNFLASALSMSYEILSRILFLAKACLARCWGQIRLDPDPLGPASISSEPMSVPRMA